MINLALIMPALTLEDLKRIVHLARLEHDPETENQLLTQLNEFFAYVKQMQQVDTHNVEPLFTPLSVSQDVYLRLREDVVTEPESEEERIAARDFVLKNAPAAEDGYFLVPKVIE